MGEGATSTGSHGAVRHSPRRSPPTSPRRQSRGSHSSSSRGCDMARTERVSYACDICGNRADALEVRPLRGQVFYVRPQGWGALSGIVQMSGGGKIKRKWDFCSEQCARQGFGEMMDDAYSPDDQSDTALYE